MTGNLKLYVWPEFQTATSPGLAFAIAASYEEAVWQMKQAKVISMENWGPVVVKKIEPTAEWVSGCDL